MFYKRILEVVSVLILFLLASSCTTTTNTQKNAERVKVEEETITKDKDFEDLAEKFLDEYLESNPETATRLGEHKFDDKLNDYSAEGVKKRLDTDKKFLKELEKIPIDNLSKENGIDHQILMHNLERSIFEKETLKEHEWNPMTYNVGGAIYGLIARDFAPLEERLASVKSRLEMIPSVVKAAKSNLRNPPRIHTETAISQNKGVISLITEDLQAFVDEAKMKKEFEPLQKQAVDALEEYGVWLEEVLLPLSKGDFRIGDENYRKKLKFSLNSDLTKEEILSRAEADLRSTQDRMYEIALPLYKKYFPNENDVKKLGDKKVINKTVLDKLAEDRPDNETIVSKAQDDVSETTDFVREKELVTVPDEPLEVIEMPEFKRGVAVAYFDSAGPLENKNETYYAIAPTPEDWDEKRRESFFKEYNDYMVKNLTVHEAMPGHYLQIMHSNKFKAPTKIRAIFRSGTFTEGWAVYSEQLMAENGYGGPEVEMQQLKMKLRVIINAIIDQKIHTDGMTEKEALDFLMNEGFQEESEASGKWRRANLTSAQLSTYYVGSVEINEIRKAYQTANPDEKSMRKMHDEMLSFGSPPPKFVREILGLK